MENINAEDFVKLDDKMQTSLLDTDTCRFESNPESSETPKDLMVEINALKRHLEEERERCVVLEFQNQSLKWTTEKQSKEISELSQIRESWEKGQKSLISEIHPEEKDKRLECSSSCGTWKERLDRWETKLISVVTVTTLVMCVSRWWRSNRK